MKAVIDLHTHTLASGHAYSTLKENIIAAKKKGLKILGVSDHAPKMPGSTHQFYFSNLRILPDVIDGLRVLKGVELNVLNGQGDVDLEPYDLNFLDYAIISLHTPCYDDLGAEGNTQAVIKAMRHPKVILVGHPDDSRLPMDYAALVAAAKANKVMIEVNNTSLSPNSFRLNARENYLTLLDLCAKEGVDVLMSSDAHIDSSIGHLDFARALLEEINFPKEQIINDYPEKLLAYLGLES